jgi:serine/threonine protein kinase
MADAEKTFGGRWRAVGPPLGKGGQGVVYKVVRFVKHDVAETLKKLRMALAQTIGAGSEESIFQASVTVVNIMREMIVEPPAQVGAAKELLPVADAVNAATALERMKTELHTLKAVQHPALIRILDDNLDERWFVTEYFAKGSFDHHLSRYKGRPLDALRAIRPIVEAVAHLHREKIVHRDVKPDNVFVADDDHLVLGDCGLAIKLQDEDRLTDTYENVGTRDWMPAWAYAMRLDDVRPTFDVFSLGKLLWAMVSGSPRLVLWYIDQPQFDLRRLFPNDPRMHLIHRILANCVVQHEPDIKVQNAGEFGQMLDATINALEGGATVPTTSKAMRCKFCGIGEYQRRSDIQEDGFAHPLDRKYTYVCNYCGHFEAFFWARNEPVICHNWIEPNPR